VAKLTENVVVRVTPGIKRAIDAEARRLNLRPADVVRMALVQAVVTRTAGLFTELSESKEGRGRS